MLRVVIHNTPDNYRHPGQPVNTLVVATHDAQVMEEVDVIHELLDRRLVERGRGA